MARQPCGQDPAKASVMAATVLAIRGARPAVSAMSSQSFENRRRCTRGLQQRKDRLKPTGDELPWAHLSQEREGPLAQDCNSGWARPTVRAQDRKSRDDGSRLLANSCSIQNRSRRPARHSYRRPRAAKEEPVNTYNPTRLGCVASLSRSALLSECLMDVVFVQMDELPSLLSAVEGRNQQSQRSSDKQPFASLADRSQDIGAH